VDEGRAARRRRDEGHAATAAGYVLGAELRACGVDFSFTPVLDLDFGASGVIGDRSFHRDPRVATMLAKSVMHGLLQAGMANCGKHFPRARLRQGRFAPGDPGRQAQPEGDPGRRRRALRVAGHHAHQRDAGARDLPKVDKRGRRASRRSG
jgi:hypothetical protein